MIRRVSFAALALSVGVLAAPALANPTDAAGEDSTIVCLGTNGGSNSAVRDGVCVWVPVGR